MAMSPSWGGASSTALEDGPTCWRIHWWVFAGWTGGGRGRTTLGSLDPSFLPAVPSPRVASLCQHLATLISWLSHTQLVRSNVLPLLGKLS